MVKEYSIRASFINEYSLQEDTIQIMHCISSIYKIMHYFNAFISSNTPPNHTCHSLNNLDVFLILQSVKLYNDLSSHHP